jgi:hypothetical protein
MTTLINTASTILARAIVWFVWSPLDRTVCRFANVTHRGRGES